MYGKPVLKIRRRRPLGEKLGVPMAPMRAMRETRSVSPDGVGGAWEPKEFAYLVEAGD